MNLANAGTHFQVISMKIRIAQPCIKTAITLLIMNYGDWTVEIKSTEIGRKDGGGATELIVG
jgi:hypothetical protein